MKSIKSIAIITFLLINSSAYPNVTLSSQDRSLFQEESKIYTRYEMISGPLLYQEDETQEFSQGFRAQDTIVIEGMYERKVYDYSRKQSAITIYRTLTKLLGAEGFTIDYNCSGMACGEVAAWRLFMGRHIAGPTKNQHYIAAHLGEKGNPVAIKVAHINEFDGQPRLIIDTVYKTNLPINTKLTQTSLLDQWLNSRTLSHLGDVYFPSSSDQLTNLNQLQELATKLGSATVKGKSVLLLGFADQRGDAFTNSILSQTRAAFVKTHLVQNTGIADAKLISYGLGEMAGPLSGARKVRVYLLD